MEESIWQNIWKKVIRKDQNIKFFGSIYEGHIVLKCFISLINLAEKKKERKTADVLKVFFFLSVWPKVNKTESSGIKSKTLSTFKWII